MKLSSFLSTQTIKTTIKEFCSNCLENGEKLPKKCHSLQFPVCPTLPVVMSYDSWDMAWFPAEHALTNSECEVKNENYYLTPDTDGHGFILDLGCLAPADGFLLRNTRNGVDADRGTEGFRVEASQDYLSWEVVLEDTLPDGRTAYDDCTLPLLTFDVDFFVCRLEGFLGGFLMVPLPHAFSGSVYH